MRDNDESVNDMPSVIEFRDMDGPVKTDAMEQRWNRYVESAKPFVINMTKARMAIATLAMKACTIHYGGGDHWKKFNGVYTLKRFAQEIGLNYKTLGNWVCTYRNVLEKLPDGVYDETKYEAARRVANKVNRNTPAEAVTLLYKKELSSSRDREYLVKGIKRLKTLHYYLTVKAYLPTLESECPKELDELYVLASEIAEKLGGRRG
jgi:hypothetical protein